MPAVANVHADTHMHSVYRTSAYVHSAAGVTPMPAFGAPGTGGIESIEYLQARAGYSFVIVLNSAPVQVSASSSQITDLVQEVRSGFGRTFSHLPEALGVSRQALYNWLKGDTPKPEHHERLRQLASAARVFIHEGFKPSALSLGRALKQGKSFLDLIRAGEDGDEVAERLVRAEQRGMAARQRLDTLLEGRKRVRPDVGDLGRQAFDESV